ncbi:hypothetical protein ACTQ1O_12320 [Bilifractor sp. LCP21S3_A7]|uniref:hypothetical protein n=1 Tax=Bilifractor sp. LCP21S3_A7 TaxID=3438738 RepID=UPI003F9061B4
MSKELTDEARNKAGKAQMQQYLGSQYPEWHLVAIESIKKLILNGNNFYADLVTDDGPLSDIATTDNINKEIRTGWLYEAVSHAEQSIEDLFSLLMCAQSPDYFARDVVVYQAGKVKNYIWDFKTDDLEYVLEQFHLPYFDLDDPWENEDVFNAYKESVLMLQEYTKELIVFHKHYYQDYCQYKHGMAVSLRYGNPNPDKLTEGAFKTFDSYTVGTRMKQTKSAPALCFDIVPETQPYLGALHDEKNLLHYSLHAADIYKFEEITQKALLLLLPLRMNLIEMSKWDGTEKVQLIAFPNKKKSKIMRIGFPCE